MGHCNSVDFKDHKTKEELRGFMNRVAAESEELKETSKRIEEEMKAKHPKTGLENCIKSYIEADTVCNVPKFVFWLSDSKKQQCMEAKMKAYHTCMQSADNALDYATLSTAAEKVATHRNKLDRILSVNEKIVV